MYVKLGHVIQILINVMEKQSSSIIHIVQNEQIYLPFCPDVLGRFHTHGRCMDTHPVSHEVALT